MNEDKTIAAIFVVWALCALFSLAFTGFIAWMIYLLVDHFTR